MHDDQQVARLFELDKSLTAGQFPVRWVQDLGFGFGYALFNFYPPLVYYLGEIFHLLGAGFVDATKVVWFIALFGSAAAMYLFVKEVFGKIPGFVSATVYLYAPYHAVDAYVRGALAELFSFVWLPLIFLFTYKLYKDYSHYKIYNSLLAGVFLAFLMVTHPLIFLPFFPLFTFWYWSLFLIYGRRQFKLTAIRYLLTTLTAFALSAFFWLPSLAEKKYTLTDQFLTQNLASYNIHFVCPSQLWNSIWGYGGSIAGCNDGVSFMLGKLLILFGVISLFVCGYMFTRKKYNQGGLIASAVIMLGFCLFMTLEYSKPIWDLVQPLWYLQFPWRFLEYASFLLAFLSGSIFLIVKKIKPQLIIASIAIVTVIVIEGRYFHPQRILSPQVADKLTDLEDIRSRVSQSSFEYMSKGIAIKSTPSGAYTLDSDHAAWEVPNYTTLEGNFRQSRFIVSPDRVFLEGTSENGAMLQFPITNFPGWQAKIDLYHQIPISDDKRLKLITIQFPAGNHGLDLFFADTPVRTIGNIISLLTLLSLPLIFYGTRRSQT